MSFYLEIEPNGFGATYQSTIYGLALCRKYGWDFRFKPYSHIHSTNTSKCNSFIGFHNYKRPESNSTNIPYTHQLYGSSYDELFTEEVINEIRSNYYSTEKPDNPYSNYIAIHIRRGDVNQNNHPDRWIGINKYKEFIETLQKKYPHKKIVICSQGQKEDFEQLANVIIDLEPDALRHFNILVESDVLLPSLSSFSFIAGLLNKNTVITDIYKLFTFWHKPPSKWVSVLMNVDIS